jgi:hypothetical protein
MIFVNKSYITKMFFKMNFKYYFIKVLSPISKDYFSNHISIFFMQVKSFGQTYKVLLKILFYFENLFLTV